MKWLWRQCFGKLLHKNVRHSTCNIVIILFKVYFSRGCRHLCLIWSGPSSQETETCTRRGDSGVSGGIQASGNKWDPQDAWTWAISVAWLFLPSWGSMALTLQRNNLFPSFLHLPPFLSPSSFFPGSVVLCRKCCCSYDHALPGSCRRRPLPSPLNVQHPALLGPQWALNKHH